VLPFITNFGKRALARATGITATLSIQLLSAWQGWPKSLTRDRIANKSVRRRARSGAVVVESRGYEYKIGRGSEFENKDPVYCTAAMYQVGSQTRRGGVMHFGDVRWMRALM